MIFSKDRHKMRQFFFDIWQKKAAGNPPLEPMEEIIAGIIEQHPEYHALLSDPDAVIDKNFTPEMGQSNPFLHMAMHIAIQEQLATQRPKGIISIYQTLVEKSNDPHATEHQMMEPLGDMLMQAQRRNTAPDEKHYLKGLKKLIKKQ